MECPRCGGPLADGGCPSCQSRSAGREAPASPEQQTSASADRRSQTAAASPERVGATGSPERDASAELERAGGRTADPPPEPGEAGDPSGGLGWLARLEAARKSTPGLPVDKGPVAPPPLPKAPDGPPPLPTKPAHRLLSRLDDAPRPPPRPSLATGDLDDLSSVDVAPPPPPAAPPRRRWWWDVAWVTLLGALLVGGVVGAWFWAREEPVAPVTVDPALAAKRARAAEIRSALEEGLARLQADEPAAAARAYRRALALEPDLASAERGLAIALAALGRQKQASRHYRRYLSLEPDAKDAAEVRRILRDWRRTGSRD